VPQSRRVIETARELECNEDPDKVFQKIVPPKKPKRERVVVTSHADHKFSITIHTDDLALVGCARALAMFSQKRGNNKIVWGGTKDDDWRRDGHRVTFRFSDPAYREGFLSELRRLLPADLWSEASRRDDDPAKPQR
jgi:hypothetical protein